MAGLGHLAFSITRRLTSESSRAASRSHLSRLKGEPLAPRGHGVTVRGRWNAVENRRHTDEEDGFIDRGDCFALVH